LRLNSKKSFVALALSISALPRWAAHTFSTDWSPETPITIASTQIKPGDYELKAEEGKSELQVLQKNKVIATVPIQWTKLPTKARASEIVADGTKVTEVEFEGRIEAAQISQ
jgi:hypothetical protein